MSASTHQAHVSRGQHSRLGRLRGRPALGPAPGPRLILIHGIGDRRDRRPGRIRPEADSRRAQGRPGPAGRTGGSDSGRSGVTAGGNSEVTMTEWETPAHSLATSSRESTTPRPRAARPPGRIRSHLGPSGEDELGWRQRESLRSTEVKECRRWFLVPRVRSPRGPARRGGSPRRGPRPRPLRRAAGPGDLPLAGLPGRLPDRRHLDPGRRDGPGPPPRRPAAGRPPGRGPEARRARPRPGRRRLAGLDRRPDVTR